MESPPAWTFNQALKILSLGAKFEVCFNASITHSKACTNKTGTLCVAGNRADQRYVRTRWGIYKNAFFICFLFSFSFGPQDREGGVVCRLGFQLACFPVYTGVMQLRVNKEVRIPVRVIVGDNILGSITDHPENKLQLTAV